MPHKASIIFAILLQQFTKDHEGNKTTTKSFFFANEASIDMARTQRKQLIPTTSNDLVEDNPATVYNHTVLTLGKGKRPRCGGSRTVC